MDDEWRMEDGLTFSLSDQAPLTMGVVDRDIVFAVDILLVGLLIVSLKVG